MKLIIGCVLIVAGFGGLLNALARASNDANDSKGLSMLGYGIIFLGVGIYLVDSHYKNKKKVEAANRAKSTDGV